MMANFSWELLAWSREKKNNAAKKISPVQNAAQTLLQSQKIKHNKIKIDVVVVQILGSLLHTFITATYYSYK
jgi:hypothetical protein